MSYITLPQPCDGKTKSPYNNLGNFGNYATLRKNNPPKEKKRYIFAPKCQGFDVCRGPFYPLGKITKCPTAFSHLRGDEPFIST